jgi:diacylglycerol kinase (ATP)
VTAGSRRICIIFNPAAGSWKRYPEATSVQARQQIIKGWYAPFREGNELHLVETSAPGTGRTAARLASAEGWDTVVAIGGDGTIRDVIGGLCLPASSARLGIIPFGTANVFARQLGLPLDSPTEAARITVSDAERPVDVGDCNGHLFVLHAGIGLDALAVARVDPQFKKRYGKLAYIASALRSASKLPPYEFVLTSKDSIDCSGPLATVHRSHQIWVANSRLYGGNHALGPETELCVDDGLLNLIVTRGCRTGAAGLVNGMVNLVMGRCYAQALLVRRIHGIHVDASPPAPVQLDGDSAGTTPATIRVHPSAIRVAVPSRRN